MYFKPVPDRLYGVLHGVNELKKCEEIWNTRLEDIKVSFTSKIDLIYILQLKYKLCRWSKV